MVAQLCNLQSMPFHDFDIKLLRRFISVDAPADVDRKTVFTRAVLPLIKHDTTVIQRKRICAEQLDLNKDAAAQVVDYAAKHPVQSKPTSSARMRIAVDKQLPEEQEAPRDFTQDDIDRAQQMCFGSGFKAGAAEQRQLFKDSMQVAAPLIRSGL